MNPDHNPYEPPQAQVADSNRTQRTRPRSVEWATTALWAAYGLTFIHAAIVIIGNGWTLWPPARGVLNQVVFELFYAVLIYFVSRGRYWARLLYAVLLGGRTCVN